MEPLEDHQFAGPLGRAVWNATRRSRAAEENRQEDGQMGRAALADGLKVADVGGTPLEDVHGTPVESGLGS